MKLMIISDIHGSAYYCERMLEAFREEKADRLVLLGDVLYHGPRNDLPREYAPKEVATMLNNIREKILCIRGNCEAEVDQMMLEFPVMADYGVIFFETAGAEKNAGTDKNAEADNNAGAGQRQHAIYLTHGHIYNEENLPPLGNGDVLLNGHTHVPACRVHPKEASQQLDGKTIAGKPEYVYMNPGSVSIPKGDSKTSYMTMETKIAGEGTIFRWKELESGEEFLRYEI